MNKVLPVVFFDAASTAGSLLSAWMEIPSGYGGSLHIGWSGDPTGALEIQFSNDSRIAREIREAVASVSTAARSVAATTTNTLLAVKAGADPAGSASDSFITLAARPKYMRVKYTRASGSGSMWAWGAF